MRANREKARFSHIFNKAREWGYTASPNPCQGVKGFRETGRSRYVTDAEFDQVKVHAHATVIDAMYLALLTGQRPTDVLNLKHADIRDGALWIVQNKTSARLGIEITGELAATIARITLTFIGSAEIVDTKGSGTLQGHQLGRPGFSFISSAEIGRIGFNSEQVSISRIVASPSPAKLLWVSGFTVFTSTQEVLSKSCLLATRKTKPPSV
nr:hypothetical protein [uncultured Albidiferax sp.]